MSMSNLLQLASKLKASSRLSGKLVMALDATGSRMATWNATRHIMNSIFRRLSDLGSLEISVGYFRGYNHDCQFTDYTSGAENLESAMAVIDCQSGETQIGRVLTHFVEIAGSAPPSAFVFIGDDQQENIEGLRVQARTLATYKIPTFWFLEHTKGTSWRDTEDYKLLATVSGGVFAEFNESAADKLEELLVAAATFAIGGRAALTKRGGEAATLLLTQLSSK